MTHLRAQCWTIFLYLDYWLLVADTQVTFQTHLHLVVSTCQGLVLMVNMKLQIVSFQFCLDCLLDKAFLPPERAKSIKLMYRMLLWNRFQPVCSKQCFLIMLAVTMIGFTQEIYSYGSSEGLILCYVHRENVLLFLEAYSILSKDANLFTGVLFGCWSHQRILTLMLLVLKWECYYAGWEGNRRCPEVYATLYVSLLEPWAICLALLPL